jgi:hypothetical protein
VSAAESEAAVDVETVLARVWALIEKQERWYAENGGMRAIHIDDLAAALRGAGLPEPKPGEWCPTCTRKVPPAPGTLAYAQMVAEQHGDLDHETEEETR